MFLKLTKAFGLQTNVTSPFWSEMLVQVQDLPPNWPKLSLYSYLPSYIAMQMAQNCLEGKKSSALEPQSSLFLWLRPRKVHFQQGKKQGTFIACKAPTSNTSKNQALLFKRGENKKFPCQWCRATLWGGGRNTHDIFHTTLCSTQHF